MPSYYYQQTIVFATIVHESGNSIPSSWKAASMICSKPADNITTLIPWSAQHLKRFLVPGRSKVPRRILSFLTAASTTDSRGLGSWAARATTDSWLFYIIVFSGILGAILLVFLAVCTTDYETLLYAILLGRRVAILLVFFTECIEKLFNRKYRSVF